jgi:hypothetical protein
VSRASAPLRGCFLADDGEWYSFDGCWRWDGSGWVRRGGPVLQPNSGRRLEDYVVGYGDGRWLPKGMPVISRYAPAEVLRQMSSLGRRETPRRRRSMLGRVALAVAVVLLIAVVAFAALAVVAPAVAPAARS